MFLNENNNFLLESENLLIIKKKKEGQLKRMASIQMVPKINIKKKKNKKKPFVRAHTEIVKTRILNRC